MEDPPIYIGGWNEIRFSQLHDAERSQEFRRILDALGKEVGAAERRIERIDKEPSGIEDILLDAECSQIEHLLGVAFVAAQGQLERTITVTKELCEIYTRHTGKTAPIDTVRTSIFKISPDLLKSGFTAIEVIEAAGNLFKHGSVWTEDWTKVSKGGGRGQNQRILLGIGLVQHSTGHFRMIAEQLGILNYSELSRIEDLIWNWTGAVHGILRPAFESDWVLDQSEI